MNFLSSCMFIPHVINPFHGDPVGAAMFDHVVTRPLLASAASAASVFTRDANEAPRVAQQTSVSADFVDGDWVNDTKL